MQKKIIGALVGLVGTTINEPKTENTDRILCEALIAACGSLSDEESDEWVARIHEEKSRVSPGCATCKNRCGNTSDYIEDPEDRLMPIKEQLIKIAAGAATKMLATGDFKEVTEIYRAIAYFGYSMDESAYIELADRLERY